MLFLQFLLYSLSFVGTLENEIPEAALEPFQLKIKKFSPDILKFSTKHKDSPFTANYSMILRTFLFIFHAGSRRLGSNSFRNSSYKEKTAGSARVSRRSSVSYDYAQSETQLTQTLLYGHQNYHPISNRLIINSTIEYLISAKKFKCLLFN